MKRARERQDVNRIMELWAESTRVYNRWRLEENRIAWCEYHEHMQRLHEGLACEHETKATLLLEAHNFVPQTPAELR